MRMMSPQDWKSSGRFCLWNAHKIFVKDEGRGRTILFIHGFPTSSWDWSKVWPLFGTSFRLLALDMLGFGFSDKPKNYSYSIVRQADLIEDLLAEMKISELSIVSHDYGDSVAQELISRYVERTKKRLAGLHIRSVCFLNGGLFPETHRPLWGQKVLASPLGVWFGRWTPKTLFIRSLRSTFGSPDALSSEEFDDLWELFSQEGGTRILHRLMGYIAERRRRRDRWVESMRVVENRLALVVGDKDPISGFHMAQNYAHLLPRSSIKHLPKIGHYPQLEAPEQVAQAVMAFLAQS